MTTQPIPTITDDILTEIEAATRRNRKHFPWDYLDGDTCHEGITHWMPLPEPPK